MNMEMARERTQRVSVLSVILLLKPTIHFPIYPYCFSFSCFRKYHWLMSSRYASKRAVFWMKPPPYVCLKNTEIYFSLLLTKIRMLDVYEFLMPFLAFVTTVQCVIAKDMTHFYILFCLIFIPWEFSLNIVTWLCSKEMQPLMPK